MDEQLCSYSILYQTFVLFSIVLQMTINKKLTIVFTNLEPVCWGLQIFLIPLFDVLLFSRKKMRLKELLHAVFCFNEKVKTFENETSLS